MECKFQFANAKIKPSGPNTFHESYAKSYFIWCISAFVTEGMNTNVLAKHGKENWQKQKLVEILSKFRKPRTWLFSATLCSLHTSAYSTHFMDMLCAKGQDGTRWKWLGL